MKDLFEIVIEVHKQSERKIVLLCLFLYYLIMNIELSFWIANKIGFEYNACELNFNSIIEFFSLYHIITVMIIFFTSIFLTKYCIQAITWILSGFFIRKGNIFKDRDFLVWFLEWINAITPEKKRGKNYDIFISVFRLITDKDSNMIRFSDYLLSVLSITLFSYYNFETLIFHSFLFKIIVFAIWIFMIYWLLNVAFFKALRYNTETIYDIILKDIK